jgi:uncharacterized protein YggU (UPF0235/DUF167 family)
MSIIRVKAFPDAKKEWIEEVEPNKLRIFVREPAERNLANKRVLTLVANFYEIPQNRLKIITGHRGQNKIIQVID